MMQERASYREPSLFRQLRRAVRPEALTKPTGADYINSRTKRALDMATAFLALPVAYPLIYGAAAINKIIQPDEPAFYSTERIGKDGKTIVVKKLRTLKSTTAGEGRPHQVAAERVYRFGQFLRRTRIDELPQLVDIIRGDLSFIGPRVMPEWDMHRLKAHSTPENFAQWKKDYLSGRPGGAGLTFNLNCLEQTTAQRMRLDRFYYQHANLGLDLYLMFVLTPYTLIGGRGIR